MHRSLRLVIALILGILAGSLVNMGLVLVSGHVIPPPAGADVTTTEGLLLAYLPTAWLGWRLAASRRA